MSIKFQVTLPETLMGELKRESVKMGMPVAEFIRQTMEDRLRKKSSVLSGDPFEPIDGLVNTDEPDLAARVDGILYR